MRKAILTVGAACLLASIGASTAFAESSTYQHFEARVIGKAGTVKKPSSIGTYLRPFHDIGILGGKTNLGGANTGALLEAPFATVQAHIYMPKEITLATTGFPQCKDTVALKTPDKCPKGSEIGKGVAAGFGRNPKTSLVGTYALQTALTVRVFILTDKNTIALRTYSGATKEGLIKGVIKKASGAQAAEYKTDIEFSIPSGLIEPLKGVISQLSSFDSTIKAVKNKKGKALQTLSGCPANGKLKFGYNGIYNIRLDTESSPKYTAPALDGGIGKQYSISEVGPIVTSEATCLK